jgi:hypothetical protein
MPNNPSQCHARLDLPKPPHRIGESAMNQVLSRAPNPDKVALIRVGRSVRARLAVDPSVHKIPTDRAEIWGVTGFLSPSK